ncbi:ChaN family lipoprotein [Candidatus Woesearchaeota archaeon]|nr:ChaN family lipoprotein [Candidatus Woesearchaeota archaeon]
MKTSKLKNLFITGLAALAFTYGCSHITYTQQQASVPQQTSVINQCSDSKQLEETILSESSKYQVVMLGEDHADLDDDYFIARLLPELKKQGFKHLAVELERNPPEASLLAKALTDYTASKISPDEMRYRAMYTVLSPYIEGLISIVEAAKKEGMDTICYDPSYNEYESSDRRDELAFKNIKALIFNKEPKAKVIVYCGAAHLNKEKRYNPHLWSWEGRLRLKNKSKDGKFKCLAYHLNKYSRGKTLTVSVFGDDPYIDCDITLDLKKNEYRKNNQEK